MLSLITTSNSGQLNPTGVGLFFLFVLPSRIVGYA